MPSVKKTGAKRASNKAKRGGVDRRAEYKGSEDIWARTCMLVEILIGVMEQEITAPHSEHSEQWLRLFGAKDSAVVNLQKLVQLLGHLREQIQGNSAPEAELVEPVNAQEMAILAEWLAMQRAAND